MNEEIYALWYNKLPSLGLRQKNQLYLHTKSFEKIYDLSWEKLEEELHKIGIRTKLTPEVYEKHQAKLATYENQSLFLAEKQVQVLHPLHPNFPSLLKELPDCPMNLFARGSCDFPGLSIGIVGARRCSGYGKKVAHFMAGELAKVGVNVVSGLAYGIDVAAHLGVLNAGGFTTAILGGGIHACYPASHQPIFERIYDSGCVLSEESFGTQTEPYMFPKRNRLISGMSHGILVVEAAQKSGSLITVDFALEQGREVFTVPNRLFETAAEGTNNLIKQGAKLVFHIDDILSEITNIYKNTEQIIPHPEKKLDEKEKIVYSCISYDPTHVEKIIESVFYSLETSLEEQNLNKQLSDFDSNITSMDSSDVQMCLLNLETEGLISKISSCYYARSEV